MRVDEALDILSHILEKTKVKIQWLSETNQIRSTTYTPKGDHAQWASTKLLEGGEWSSTPTPTRENAGDVLKHLCKFHCLNLEKVKATSAAKPNQPVAFIWDPMEFPLDDIVAMPTVFVGGDVDPEALERVNAELRADMQAAEKNNSQTVANLKLLLPGWETKLKRIDQWWSTEEITEAVNGNTP